MDGRERPGSLDAAGGGPTRPRGRSGEAARRRSDPWAEAPRADEGWPEAPFERWAGPAEPPVDADDPEAGSSDYQRVLADIQEAIDDLRFEAPAAPVRPNSAPASRAGRPAPGARPGTPRGYADARGGFLDERLATSRALARAVRGEVVVLERRVADLRAESERLDRELDLALQELEYVRLQPWELDRPGNALLAEDPEERAPETAPPVIRSGRAAARAPRPYVDPAAASGAPYEEFTAERQRATVDALHARRPALRTATLVVSVVVSLALFLVTWRYLATPSFDWMAGLPLVWMIPVPFFATAFYGTHRILAHRSLELPAPP